MYCRHCGTEIPDAAVICPECGTPVGNDDVYNDRYDIERFKQSKISKVIIVGAIFALIFALFALEKSVLVFILMLFAIISFISAWLFGAGVIRLARVNRNIYLPLVLLGVFCIIIGIWMIGTGKTISTPKSKTPKTNSSAAMTETVAPTPTKAIETSKPTETSKPLQTPVATEQPTPTVIETEETDTRPQKNGFNSATNIVYPLASYTIEIPDYWDESEKTFEDGDFFMRMYAETGGKSAYLQVASASVDDEDGPVTFSELLAINKDMIQVIEESAFKDVTDYKIVDVGCEKGILYYGKGMNGVDDEYDSTGMWFMIPSEVDQIWCYVIYVQTGNTEYRYEEDFMRIIKSIKPAQNATETSIPPSTPTPTPAPTPAPTSTPESSPVYYSTNTRQEVRNGNSGVYSYKRSGRNYDLYWIIDFDEGYAYSFTYGNGSSVCERVHIDSGDLNEYIVVTYHDGDYTFQRGLCFKRKYQSDRLIESDTSGNAFEYIATDLKDALAIRDTLTITDY